MKAMMLGWVAVTMLGAGSAQARHLVIRGPGDLGSAELELRDGEGPREAADLVSGELERDVRVQVDEALDSVLFAQNEAPPVAPPAPPVPPAVPRGGVKATPPTPPTPPQPLGPRLKGKLPAPVQNVSIDADDEHIGDILDEIADGAGINLVITAPRALLRQRLTLKLSDVPADQALEAVLETSQLEAEVKGKMVSVRAAPGAMPDIGSEVAERVLEKAGKHGRVRDAELVVFGQPLEVKLGETVEQAVAVGGPLTIRGHVTGDAVAIGGPVVVYPGAEVDGDVVSMGGPVQVMEGAVVKGDKVALSGGALAGIGGLMSGMAQHNLTSGIRHAFGWVWTLLRYLTLLVVALLLVAFVPERVQRVRRFLVARPGASTLAGFAMLVGILPLCLLLAVTLIGIPLVPVAIFLLFAFMVMGLTAFMVLLGERLPVLQGKKTLMIEMLIGLAIIFLVDLLPVIGTLFVVIVSFIAGGAALLSRFGTEPKVPAAPAAPPAEVPAE